MRDLPSEQDAAAIARAIITLASSPGLEGVAEGVEEGGQLDFLRDEGCGAYQGFPASRAAPPGEVEALLRRLLDAG